MNINGYKNLKKTELHLHIDGSVRLTTAQELLAKDGKYYLISELKDLMHRDVHQKYQTMKIGLQIFDLPISIMQTEKNIERITFELLEDLHFENYIYAEIRFAPIQHLQKGLTMEQVVAAACAGLQRAYKTYGITSRILLCAMRNQNQNNAAPLIDLYHQFKNQGVGGIDLAGNETDYPVTNFTDFFNQCYEQQIPVTIHAGEGDDWTSVDNALKLHAKRIGHGFLSILNPEFIKNVEQNYQDVCFELCPVSNDKKLYLNNIKEQPIAMFEKTKLNFCLNTDNRTVACTNLLNEYVYLNTHDFNGDLQFYNKCFMNGLKFSFLEESLKAELLDIMTKHNAKVLEDYSHE